MKFLTLFGLLVGTSAHGENKIFKCDFLWNTYSENISLKQQHVKNYLLQKISPNITATVTIDNKTSKLQIKEYYNDNKKNFIEHNFSCDSSLNCIGSRIKMAEGKIENESITSAPSSTYGVGKIGKREIFQYQNTGNGFKYNYIIYRNEKDEPMGLKVSCRQKQ